MSVQVKHRRDTAANIAGFTPAQGELIVDTTNNRVIVGDGTTVGGWAAAKLAEAPVATRRAVSDINTSVAASDRLVGYSSLTAARTVTLCAASAFPTGTVLRLIDESGACSSTNTLTISRSGSDTICGGASLVLSGAYMSAALESDGVSKWTSVNNGVNEQVALLGVGTAPDASNPFSVYGASALFNGANFSFTINKSAAANTASVLFQDGFSARAQIGLLGSDNFAFKVSANGSTYSTGLVFDAATGAPTFGNARTAVSDAAYTALSTDREIAYTTITAARIVTLPAAASFPPGHALVVIDESGAASLTNSITISAVGADTIGGRSNARIMTAYGHVRLVSNGSNAWAVAGRSANVLIFSTVGASAYTPTPGLVKADVYLVAGGGGGGGGALQSASSLVSGGGGGGGGGAAHGVFTAAQIGASQIVTLGAGGTAGAAATSSSTSGGAGGQGGTTTFGALLPAYGGGGGGGGQLSGGSAGGQGGNATYAAGASGAGATGGNNSSGLGAGGSAGFGVSTAYYGIGSGGSGGAATGASTSGPLGCRAPAGGGSGGGITAANSAQTGANGGASYATGTYGLGGAAVGASGTAASAPSVSARALNLYFAGGGGGGAASLTAAGAGGAGGSPGGGGGGGGSAQNGGTAGAGGAGGAGYAIIVESF